MYLTPVCFPFFPRFVAAPRFIFHAVNEGSLKMLDLILKIDLRFIRCAGFDLRLTFD